MHVLRIAEQYCVNPHSQYCGNPHSQYCVNPHSQYCGNPHSQHCVNPSRVRTSSLAEKAIPPHMLPASPPPHSRGRGGNSMANLPHSPSPRTEGASAGRSTCTISTRHTPSPFSGVEGGNMRAAGTLQLQTSRHLPASPTPGVEGGSSRLTGNHHEPRARPPSPTRPPHRLAMFEIG